MSHVLRQPWIVSSLLNFFKSTTFCINSGKFGQLLLESSQLLLSDGKNKITAFIDKCNDTSDLHGSIIQFTSAKFLSNPLSIKIFDATFISQEGCDTIGNPIIITSDSKIEKIYQKYLIEIDNYYKDSVDTLLTMQSSSDDIDDTQCPVFLKECIIPSNQQDKMETDKTLSQIPPSLPRNNDIYSIQEEIEIEEIIEESENSRTDDDIIFPPQTMGSLNNNTQTSPSNNINKIEYEEDLDMDENTINEIYSTESDDVIITQASPSLNELEQFDKELKSKEKEINILKNNSDSSVIELENSNEDNTLIPKNSLRKNTKKPNYSLWLDKFHSSILA